MAEDRIIIPDAINGIDVSSSNGNIDFQRVADAGFRFVYIQSSRYSSTIDEPFYKHANAAQKAGLKIGAYHFCSHGTSPEEQMKFFHKPCTGLGSASGELPPMIDWEFCTPSKYQDHPRHCVDWLERACEEAWNLWQVEPVVYSYPSYCEGHQPDLGQSKSLVWRRFCYASYPNKEKYVPESKAVLPFHKVPDGFQHPVLVQYSGDKGARVPGVAGACDRQVFLGDEEEWNNFIGC